MPWAVARASECVRETQLFGSQAGKPYEYMQEPERLQGKRKWGGKLATYYAPMFTFFRAGG